MKRMLFPLLTVASLAAVVPGAAAPVVSPPPNIVYILADDLGYGDVACYNSQSKLPTPHIDRLATEGMRFTDVHSASACTPTRYGILTGRYAFRSRVPWAVLDSYDPPLIEAGRMTVPALLKRQGYRTACIGKWHLGWDWPKGNRPDGEPDFTQPIANGPITRGFDEYFGTHVPNQPPFAFIENDRLTEQPTARFPGKDAEQFVFKSGPMVPGWKFENIMPTLAARVETYLRARAQDRQRFFLYYTLTIPHEPLAPTAEFMGKSGINRVGDLILQTDAAVGAVLDALKKMGLEENTLVIFASDNGHGPGTGVPALLAAGHDPSRPYRGYKGSLLEGGHRIPFIVRWPGKVKPGVVCDELISLTNLMATCAELTGTQVPADAGEDSHSILPLLLDRPGAYSTHETLVHAGGNGFAVRQGPWKLVHAKAISPERQKMYPEATSGLFNVERDPAERNNLIAQHPDIASKLEEQLNKIRRGGGLGSEVTPSPKPRASVSDTSNSTDDENARMPVAPKPIAAKSSDPVGGGPEKLEKYPGMAQAMDYIRSAIPKTIKVQKEDWGDLVGVPHPYTAPCAKEGFQQLFYWDTYFINLGLLRLGLKGQARNNVDDLLFLVEKFGLVPSASRRSMANRSQTPFLGLMVRDIFTDTKDRDWARGAYTTLTKEYNFWMTSRLSPIGLNRLHHSATESYLLSFYDYLARERFKGLTHTTRAEKLAFSSQALSEAEIWDFTPRFDRRAEEFCPVDQNSNLFVYEEILAELSTVLGNGEEVGWRQKAAKRRELVQKYLWNADVGCYTDYDFAKGKKGDMVSCAALYPLLAGIATPEQSKNTRRAATQ